MTSATATERHRRRRNNWAPVASQIVPDGATLPKPVREAAAKAREAHAATAEAEQLVGDAKVHAQQSRVPEAHEERIRAAAVEFAEKEQAERDALYDQADAILAAKPKWLETQTKVIEDGAADIRRRIDELEGAFADLDAAQALLQALDRFDGAPSDWFDDRTEDPARRERQRERARRNVASVAQFGRDAGQISLSPDALVAALEIVLDRMVGHSR